VQHIKVIKIGGNIVDNPEMLEKFAADFASFKFPKVLVHGGGILASRMQKALGREPVMIDGRRVTDEAALKIVTMVYAGWCSKSIVALMQKYGCNAIGLCGADANIIEAVKRPPATVKGDSGNSNVTTEGNRTAKTVDYGFVGDVDPEKVNSGFILSLMNQGITPAICAITHDKEGNLLNTNADTVASSVAVALSKTICGSRLHESLDTGNGTPAHAGKVSLIYCFEKDGVLYDKDDDSSLIPEISPEKFAALKADGRVAAGMIPKIENSFKALEAGVGEVVIKHARNLTNDVGTRLTLH